MRKPIILGLTLAIQLVACNKLDKPVSSEVTSQTQARDLTFVGTDFAPHEGHPLKVALIDRDRNERVFLTDASISGGKFSLVKAKTLLDGHRYFLDYFADANNNGQCDAPLTDHVWRIAIDAVSANVAVNDTHKMNFHDSCASFASTYGAPAGTTQVTLTGRLLLGDSVTDTEGLSPGQALVGASVFVEGLADQDAVTDNTGVFKLSVTVPKDQALTGSEHRLVMWYTQRQPGKSSTDWSLASARFGATKSIGLQANQDLGDQKLGHTKGVTFRVVSAADQTGVSSCWVRSKTLGNNLIVLAGDSGHYTVDYLPPGDYDIAIDCLGYAPTSTRITVGDASSKGGLETAPDVLVSAE